MPFESPRMMPGQTPYTEEEYRTLQMLLNAAMEEETGGYPVGSPAWMYTEMLRDVERDLWKLSDDPDRFHPIRREQLFVSLTADRQRLLARIEGETRR